jgi:hypothetical protein
MSDEMSTPTPNRLGLLLTEELVQEIADLFPIHIPLVSDTDRQVWYKAGQCSVVEVLRNKLSDISDNPLYRVI